MVDNMGFTRYDYGKKGYLPMNRPFMGFSNPLSDNALDYSGEQVHTLHANVGADVELGKGFKFVTNNTLYLIAARGESLANPYYGQSAESSKGQVAVGSDLDVRQNFQQILNYSRTFGGVHKWKPSWVTNTIALIVTLCRARVITLWTTRTTNSVAVLKWYALFKSWSLQHRRMVCTCQL